jgi:ComF family protein
MMPPGSSVAGLKENFFDLIFPKFCLSCGAEGNWLCRSCRQALKIQPKEICPVCRREVVGAKCPGDVLSKLWVLSEYHEPLIENSIRRLKYDFLTALISEVWSLYLNNFWLKFNRDISHRSLLVPVPLHRRKLLERGFNQSTLIARELSEISALEAAEGLLVRKIYNQPQVGLIGEKRRKNVQGIFKVDYRALSDYWNREIILIDDVHTTGSTIGECAMALHQAGFRQVSALVLAIG